MKIDVQVDNRAVFDQMQRDAIQPFQKKTFASKMAESMLSPGQKQKRDADLLKLARKNYRGMKEQQKVIDDIGGGPSNCIRSPNVPFYDIGGNRLGLP